MASFRLSDFDGSRTPFPVFAYACLLIKWILWVSAIFAIILTTVGLASTDTTSSPPGAQVATALAAVLLSVAAWRLSPSLDNARLWAQLPGEGSVTVGPSHVRLTHSSVLRDSVNIPLDQIAAIAVDGGGDHEKRGQWRRFPLVGGNSSERYLFDSEGPPRASSVLLSSRPIAPNIALLLHVPIVLTNPNAGLATVAFSLKPVRGMPSRPPARETKTRMIFMHAASLPEAQEILASTGLTKDLWEIDSRTKSSRTVSPRATVPQPKADAAPTIGKHMRTESPPQKPPYAEDDLPKEHAPIRAPRHFRLPDSQPAPEVASRLRQHAKPQ